MSDEKYVGAIAAAKNVALVKAALDKKLDKSGGTITGSLKVDGIINAGMSLDVKSSIDAEGYIHSGELLLAPTLALSNEAKDASVYVGVTGDNAAKVTSNGSDGKLRYARLAVGTPTGDNDAATKAYVDGLLTGADYYDIYVKLPNSSDASGRANGCYTYSCVASHTYAEIKAARVKGATPRVLIVDDIASPGVTRIVCPLEEYDDGTDGSYVFSAPGIIGVCGSGKIDIDADRAQYICSAGELPAVSDSDDGKYVLVDGGKYTYKTPPAATTAAPGYMSAADKAKLDGVESGANKTVVDAALNAGSANPVQNKAVKAALDNKADKTALDTKADTTVATASANGLMSAADKKKLDSMYDIVATSTDGETFDITPAQLHEKLKGVPTTCAIKVVDTVIPLYRVYLPGDGSTSYVFQTTRDNGVWNPNTMLSYTATAGGPSAGTMWVKSEGNLRATTPGVLKFTGAADAQFSGSKDVTIDIPTGEGAVRYDETQELTSNQKFKARANIGAVSQKGAWMEGTVMLLPSGADGSRIINITPSDKSNDYTLTLDAGPENVPTYVAGIETPTDTQTDYAANVAYVKKKIAENLLVVTFDTANTKWSKTPAEVKAYIDANPGKPIVAVRDNALMIYQGISVNGYMTFLGLPVGNAASGSIEPSVLYAKDTDSSWTYQGASGAPTKTLALATTRAPVIDGAILENDTILRSKNGSTNCDVSVCTGSDFDSPSDPHDVVNFSGATFGGDVVLAGIATPDFDVYGRTDVAVSLDYLNTVLDELRAGGGSITVDSELSDTSTNPVQNKVIKAALDALPTGGVTVDSALSATSTNPIQNKAVKAALDGKASTAAATTGAAGLMSAADKAKIDGVETGANKTTVDAALNANSVNPVQNKAVKTALDGKMDKSGGTFTGNVNGKYFCGTWLQSTAATDLGKKPGKIAVLDDTGWVYYRTPAEILADIGAAAAGHTHDCYTKAETDAAIAVRASTSAYGTTKLSNSVTSSSKTLAATPYAVKTALAQAKAYVDAAITVAINSAY